MICSLDDRNRLGGVDQGLGELGRTGAVGLVVARGFTPHIDLGQRGRSARGAGLCVQRQRQGQSREDGGCLGRGQGLCDGVAARNGMFAIFDVRHAMLQEPVDENGCRRWLEADTTGTARRTRTPVLEGNRRRTSE